MPSPFTRDTLNFLVDLSMNNQREWFNAHKDVYERDVREPALAFIRAVGARMGELSPHFLAETKKSGGSLMRVYRDTRFSKDKTPYKTNIGIQFRHAAGKDVHAPGYYLHIAPNELFVGVGTYRPERDALARIRRGIDGDPDGWRAAIGAPGFAGVFTLVGESLKRPPRGYAKDHPLIDDLKRKDHIAARDITTDDVLADDFVDRVMTLFAAASPYMRFLCRHMGVAF